MVPFLLTRECENEGGSTLDLEGPLLATPYDKVKSDKELLSFIPVSLALAQKDSLLGKDD